MFNMKKELVKSIIPSAIACTIISFLLNYFIIPMSDNIIGHAVGNGVSRLFSGGISLW